MGGIEVTWRFRLLKSFCYYVQDGHHVAPFWKSSFVSWIEPNLVEGIGATWRFRIAKTFHSNIQDVHHGGPWTWWKALECYGDSELLKSFFSDSQDQTTSTRKSQVGFSQNLKGVTWATWRFRIAKIIPFWYPRIEDKAKVPLTVSCAEHPPLCTNTSWIPSWIELRYMFRN